MQKEKKKNNNFLTTEEITLKDFNSLNKKPQDKTRRYVAEDKDTFCCYLYSVSKKYVCAFILLCLCCFCFVH
jgi:hypothetical protein